MFFGFFSIQVIYTWSLHFSTMVYMNMFVRTDKYMNSLRGKWQLELIRFFTNWAWFMCAVTPLPTGGWSIGIKQVQSQRRWITGPLAPFVRRHLIQSAQPSHFCHFLAGPLNPSSCLPPAGVSTTHQMAPLAWKTFTLSVWTWQICCQAFTSLPPVRRWRGGSVFGTVISQRQGSVLVSVWTVWCPPCVCVGILPPLEDQ